MYWPVGTPRIYATSSSAQPTTTAFNFVVSHDGLSSSPDRASLRSEKSEKEPERPPLLSALSTRPGSQDALGPPTPITPVTPATPLTPGIKSVEHEYPHHHAEGSPHRGREPGSHVIPLREPVVALRVAKSGQIFAVVTATSMTIWQTKVRVSLTRACGAGLA
jgi:hypothetical protein